MNDFGAAKAVFAHMRALDLKSGDEFSASPLQTQLIFDGFVSDDFMAAIDGLSSDGLIKGDANANLYLTDQGYRKLQR